MDLVYTEEQEAYRTGVQRFVKRVLTPLHNSKYDFTRPLSREEVASLRADVAGHEIATEAPVDENGRLDQICLGIFIEELSRLNPNFASLATAIFFPVWDLGSLLKGSQQESFGHLFAPGKMVSMGMSEPNVGSNMAAMETTARRDGDGWILNGTKLWTSHAEVAVGIVVAARNLETDRISLFIVDREKQSYDVRRVPMMGQNGISTCEVRFDNCKLASNAELTPDAGGLSSALRFIEQARIRIIFMAVGIAQAALDLAVEHAKTRIQFGKSIASFQLIQGHLADMAIEIEAARLLGYRVASQAMAGQNCRKTVSIAKAYATEAAVRVASRGVQIHGAMGLSTECRAERYFRDARMLTIPDGATEIHKLVIGRALTGINAIA